MTQQDNLKMSIEDRDKKLLAILRLFDILERDDKNWEINIGGNDCGIRWIEKKIKIK